MTRDTKRLKKIRESFDASKNYSLEEGLALVKKNATAKFDETIELALNLTLDPRKADQNLRGVVALPHGSGKKVKVAVFAKDAKAEEAREAGADIVGAEDLLETIKSGTIDFDRCIATPDMMALVGRLGKVLGPKGLMPNPKLGTVTMQVGDAVKAAKAGQVEYRAEKTGIIHTGVGKASFPVESLVDNTLEVIRTILKNKPSTVKGTFLKGAHLSSTMGPGIVLDLQKIPQ